MAVKIQVKSHSSPAVTLKTQVITPAQNNRSVTKDNISPNTGIKPSQYYQLQEHVGQR